MAHGLTVDGVAINGAGETSAADLLATGPARTSAGPLLVDTIDMSQGARAAVCAMTSVRVFVSPSLPLVRAVFDLGDGRRLRLEDGFFQVV